MDHHIPLSCIFKYFVTLQSHLTKESFMFGVIFIQNCPDPIFDDNILNTQYYYKKHNSGTNRNS